MLNVFKFQTLYSYFFGLNFAYYAIFYLKCSGMANSVDPDQTVASYTGLSETLVYKILKHLPYQE